MNGFQIVQSIIELEFEIILKLELNIYSACEYFLHTSFDVDNVSRVQYEKRSDDFMYSV